MSSRGEPSPQPPPDPGASELTCESSIAEEHWVERGRRKLTEGSYGRRLYDNFFLPLDPPTEFTEPEDQLAAKLIPRSSSGVPEDARTAEVLEEAWGIYGRAEERIDSAERRATTLQGAITIAATLLLSGAAFLADPAKVHGQGWRDALGIVFLAVVVCLLMAGLRALAVTSRIHVFHRPTATEITTRAAMASAEARGSAAAEVLRSYACNTKVADWKVAYLGAAAWWFRLALASLLLFALLLVSYVVSGSTASPMRNSDRETDATPVSWVRICDVEGAEHDLRGIEAEVTGTKQRLHAALAGKKQMSDRKITLAPGDSIEQNASSDPATSQVRRGPWPLRGSANRPRVLASLAIFISPRGPAAWAGELARNRGRPAKASQRRGS